MGLTMRELCLDTPEVPESPVSCGPALCSPVSCSPVSCNDAAPHAWYALMVKHQHERPLASALRQKGFEALAPFYKTSKHWSDRVKVIELPLFPGYVLCRFRFDQRTKVLDTPGVSRVVSFNGSPAPVSGEEIEAIRVVMTAKAPVRPWPHLKPGDRVRIERGALRGIEGTLLREKDVLRLIIGVELLQRSVAVEIDADWIAPAGASHLSAASAMNHAAAPSAMKTSAMKTSAIKKGVERAQRPPCAACA